MKAIKFGLAVIIGLLASTANSNEDVKHYPHIIADRASGNVVIEAQTSEVGTGEPIEFVLINKRSGHDYEALAITNATAADIRAALEFIGLEPGRTTSYNQMRFWPRGARVEVFFEWLIEGEDGADESRKLPAREILKDVRKPDQRFPSDAFVFTGSHLLTRGEDGEQALAADVREPHSIISTYNEPNSLLDLNWQASQGGEYGNILINPDNTLPQKHPLRIHLQPATGQQALREIDLILKVEPDTEKDTAVGFTLKHEDGEAVESDGSLTAVMSQFEKLSEDLMVPHVRLDFDHALSIELVTSVSVLIAQAESDGALRIEPPLSGELYYRAFLPDSELKDRDTRGLQPVELHLLQEADKISVEVVKAVRIWDDDDEFVDSYLDVRRHPVEDPESAKEKMLELRDRIPVLLVHVDYGIALGEIMSYVGPVLEQFPTVFILIEESE